MLHELIRKAVAVGRRLQIVFVATADPDGLPHLVTARGIDLAAPDRIAVEDWFCPGTVENVRRNPRIAIVVWDAGTDLGHQLLGEVERIDQTAVMNGFAPDLESAGAMPQAEHRLIVRVRKVLFFSKRPRHARTLSLRRLKRAGRFHHAGDDGRCRQGIALRPRGGYCLFSFCNNSSTPCFPSR